LTACLVVWLSQQHNPHTIKLISCKPHIQEYLYRAMGYRLWVGPAASQCKWQLLPSFLTLPLFLPTLRLHSPSTRGTSLSFNQRDYKQKWSFKLNCQVLDRSATMFC